MHSQVQAHLNTVSSLLLDLASWVQVVRLNKLEGAQMGLHFTLLTTLHRSLVILEGPAG
jgi:hypothetical protein